MSRSSRVWTWSEVRDAVNAFEDDWRHRAYYPSAVYGIPSGGIVLAAMFADRLKLTLLSSRSVGPVVLIDDIIDSGDTIDKFRKPGDLVYSMVARQATALKADRVYALSEDWAVFPWEHKDIPGAEVIARMIQLIGDDPTRSGLKETPQRVVKAWGELFKGYQASEPNYTVFDEPHDQMIVSRDIAFYSFCEHHLLPFFGKAHIAYIPQGRVLGLSKLARVVDYFARRLQVQERLTEQIADKIDQVLDPLGVGVVLQGSHMCMMARGVQQASSIMVTSAVRGALKQEGSARAEFLQLLRAANGGG